MNDFEVAKQVVLDVLSSVADKLESSQLQKARWISVTDNRILYEAYLLHTPPECSFAPIFYIELTDTMTIGLIYDRDSLNNRECTLSLGDPNFSIEKARSKAVEFVTSAELYGLG